MCMEIRFQHQFLKLETVPRAKGGGSIGFVELEINERMSGQKTKQSSSLLLLFKNSAL